MSVRGTGTSTGSRLEITRPSTRTFVGSLKTNFLPAVSSAGRSTAEARARCATTYVPALRSTVVRGTPASTAGTGHCTESLVTWGESSTVASKDGFVLALSAMTALPVPTDPMTPAAASGRAPADTMLL